MFNEKETEMGLPVWQSPKYKESKQKALEIIQNDKYGLSEGDFWILTNKNKDKTKMIYTGLIISHNGCLKINDNLEGKLKFKPNCVSRSENGYNNSLIYEYCNDEQGLFEVGEVSKSNYSNNSAEYPYAMAFKRLFDRVVLKNCKLAYAGIYSDSEAEEFKKKDEEEPRLDKNLIDELVSLGGDLESIANYYKCDVEDLTDSHLKQIITAKKNKMARTVPDEINL